MNLHKGKKIIVIKWVFKTKFNVEGKVLKHKERLVAIGFLQQYWVDHNKTDKLQSFINSSCN